MEMKTLIIMMICSIVYLVAMDVVNKKINSFDFSSINPNIESQQETNYYTVTIKGAINNPGTYTVSKGDTLSYLITLAGGVNENADSSTYNLNTILSNNTTYYIGKISENDESKISINEASVALLDTLPGIGNVLAKRIVSYRNSEGKFQYLEEITKVNGIGESLFEQIKDLICL